MHITYAASSPGSGGTKLDGNFFVGPRSPRAPLKAKKGSGVHLVHGDMETSERNLTEVKFTKYINDIFLGIVIFLDNLSIFHLSNAKKKYRIFCEKKHNTN